jgi:hypothetical protein
MRASSASGTPAEACASACPIGAVPLPITTAATAMPQANPMPMPGSRKRRRAMRGGWVAVGSATRGAAGAVGFRGRAFFDIRNLGGLRHMLHRGVTTQAPPRLSNP